MLDVGAKITTLREAKATGFLKLAPATLERLRSGDTPKPDVLATARAAALLGAKKTPELIPHCHPIALDALNVELAPESGGIRVYATAAAIARTGVEMEALCAVQVACLTLYDLLKAVDKGMVIEGVRLLEKSGGKGDFGHDLKNDFKAAVVVTSDRSFRGQAEDKTGPWLVRSLLDLGVREPSYHLLPDEEEQIRDLFLKLHQQGYDLVVSTGGTGLSPRDRTVEALRPILDRELPGAMEAARAYGQARTPYAMLSRGLAGQRGQTLYVTLPGSSGGVRDSFTALFPALFHASHVMAQRAAKPGGAGSGPGRVVRVRASYYGGLRARLGLEGQWMELVEGSRVQDLARAACGHLGPEWPAALSFAVNDEMAASDAALKDGDEVALLPPVCGGLDGGGLLPSRTLSPVPAPGRDTLSLQAAPRGPLPAQGPGSGS